MVHDQIEDRVDRALTNGCLILAVKRIGHIDRVISAVCPIQETLKKGYREWIMCLLGSNRNEPVTTIVIAELDAFQVSVGPPNALCNYV